MSEQDRFFNRANALLDRVEALFPEVQAPAPPTDSPAYRWLQRGYRGQLQAIEHISRVQLDDLLCVDAQKEKLVRNTRQFLAGLPANNALLWGPRGTGKSSLLKALLNDFSDRGLRLIEVEKGLLKDLPEIAGALPDRDHRYIIYCDDLSFESGDPGYKALKVMLDGSLSRMPDNLLIYATSNRRHLLPEYQSDNQASQIIDGELHHSEAVEEKISLSERFGLWLAFHPFSQDDYLTIVQYWLNQQGIAEFDDEIRQQALRWALEHGSRSGRVASQFARDYAGRNQLDDREHD
ncbi:putative AAA+ superfamily ATPase [Methylohalomonas lacus]|uniref:AAA+ superfamily ATPase n=1 Tax=Methylohalomonas lacus TaxID=398773 RepID=A0AAE3HJE1_9GAMM|nr:ATP-binding protein [Methylohalomonas lacus]MCS3902298.1 putative AAA+ superfamily ATPase [Methylohalomonas lacus]